MVSVVVRRGALIHASRFEAVDQDRRVHVERLGEPHDRVQRDAAGAPLDIGNVGGVEAGGFGESHVPIVRPLRRSQATATTRPLLDRLALPDSSTRQLGCRCREGRIALDELVHSLARNAEHPRDLRYADEMACHRSAANR